MGNVVQLGRKRQDGLDQIIDNLKKDLPELDTIYVITRNKDGEFGIYVAASDVTVVLACAQVAMINSASIMQATD